jgi:hypothetical protein
METAVYLNNEDAELFKEFCRQHDFYVMIAAKVLDNPGGYVKLQIDENSVIRKIEASRTFIIT